MAPVTNPADDAATEALIARLIAEDFGENVDSLRIGGSVEDYEDPLTSYERGVIDGTISDVPSWGDPISGSDSSPCSGTEIPEYTGEGWDDSAAWDEASCTDEDDSRMVRQGRCEDDTKQPPDIECCLMAPTSMIRTCRRASSLPNLDTTNATHPTTCFQRTCSDVLPQTFEPPTPGPTCSDTVSDSPVLGPQRNTPTSCLESRRDPSPLELNRASSPLQATVLHPRKELPHHSRSDLSPPFDASEAVLPVKPTKEEGVSQAAVSHKPTQCYQPYNTAELLVPRLSAADRYAGLDIDYSSSKGKGRARAFDRSNIDTNDDDGDGDNHPTDLKCAMRDFERKFCESDSLLNGWNDSDGDDPPFVYIPFPGLALGRDEQEIRRLEDLAVVEIHVGEEETLESILNDICSPADQKARVRLEASVSRAVLSIGGTQGSADTTSVEASSTLGTQGSTDSTSFGPSTSSDSGLRGRPSRGNEPPMRSLREERRRAYYRDKKGWKPKKNDAELLLGVQVRSEDEILKKMPKQGEDNGREEEEEEDEEASRGRKRKPQSKKRMGKGKGKEEEVGNEDEEASEGRLTESEALPLSEALAKGAQEMEGEGSP